MKENEKQEYKIKFYFDDKRSYEVNYVYDSESSKIKCIGLENKLDKKIKKLYFGPVCPSLCGALIYTMWYQGIHIRNSEGEISENLLKVDLGEDFLVDIIPYIFELQNFCKKNLEVEVPYVPYMGNKNEIDKKKIEQIINQIDSLYNKDRRGGKIITFVERHNPRFRDEGVNSWIRSYVCGGGEDGYGEQAKKCKTKYANWKRKEMEQQKEEADSYQKIKIKEIPYLDYKPLENNENLDSQKSKTNEKISLGGKIARIIFLILLIAIAIFLLTYLGIVGLLFSNVAIPIVVFSVEAILITLIVILILSIKNINRQNDLLRQQIDSYRVDGKNKLIGSEYENVISENKGVGLEREK